ncbi:hypothetical protein EK21DRAFT_62183 [Setomelanomma holmii]|uniref:Uncharacterized protein n=1 Tax=Setomelanomma holmii TaxID=210430 RepID=A0A9P4HBD9_9PLEO|nr:hypothetical protein EK21DRAFT_62183 [Setomelanomma holmii]
MTSGTLSSLFVLFLSCSMVLGQSANTQQVQFNQVLNINGDMNLNSFQFPDRSRVETFSQKQQQLIVNQQTPAIPANQVTGTTGQPFVAISQQSMTISTNGATDLVGGQVQMAINMQNLQSAAVQPDNTYVAMLSPDRQTWQIQETMRSVNSTDMTVRMVKRNQLDGEYMILGRQTVETNTLVQPFGNDAASSVAIQGTGLQENEFQDGFRMSTRATQPLTMNVDVVDGIDSSMLAGLQKNGQDTVNDYRYKVTTNLGAVVPDLNQQVTVVQMPINAVRIQKMMQAMGVPPTGQVAIGIAQRGVLQNPGGATGNLGGAAGAGVTARALGRDMFRKNVARQNGQTQAGTPTNNNNPVAAQLLLAPTFTPVQANAVLDQANLRIAVPVRQVDGEFILTMQKMGGVQAVQPAQGQTPTEGAQTATSSAASLAPTAEQGQRPSTQSSTPPLEADGNKTSTAEPAKKPERRQESDKDKYGNVKPPQGAVIMSMKMIDDMVLAVQWAGQAPITQMMNDYVKAQTGQGLQSLGGNSTDAGAKIVV